MLTKLSQTQMNVVGALLEDYHLFQSGTKSGNLLRYENGINNPHPDIATVNIRTIQRLKKSKMIEIKKRQQWDKWWGATEKAQSLFLSLYNTYTIQNKFRPHEV